MAALFSHSDYDLEALSQDTTESGVKKLERTVNRVETIKKMRTHLHNGGFDG